MRSRKPIPIPNAARSPATIKAGNRGCTARYVPPTVRSARPSRTSRTSSTRAAWTQKKPATPITAATTLQKIPAARLSPAARSASAESRSSTAKTVTAVRKNCQRNRLYKPHASLSTVLMSMSRLYSRGTRAPLAIGCWRRATTSPACQPGARPPAGGCTDST